MRYPKYPDVAEDQMHTRVALLQIGMKMGCHAIRSSKHPWLAVPTSIRNSVLSLIQPENDTRGPESGITGIPLEGTGTDGELHVRAERLHHPNTRGRVIAGALNGDDPEGDPPPTNPPMSGRRLRPQSMVTPCLRGADGQPISSRPTMSRIDPDLEADELLNAQQKMAITEARYQFLNKDPYMDQWALEHLQAVGLTADVAYNRIHQAGNHEFSTFKEDAPHGFALRWAEETRVGTGAFLIDNACGAGRDSIPFAKMGAKVICIDSSKVVLEELKRNIEGKSYAANIFPVHANLLQLLANPYVSSFLDDEFIRRHHIDPNARFSDVMTHFFTFSGTHFYPPAFSREIVIPGIFRLLKPKQGYLGMAMKTDKSTSAQPERHYRLTQSDGYNTSLDRKDLILRTYQELVVQKGDIGRHASHLKIEVESVEGYDIPGEVEQFACSTAQA